MYAMRGRLASTHGAFFLLGALAGVDSLPACASEGEGGVLGGVVRAY